MNKTIQENRSPYVSAFIIAQSPLSVNECRDPLPSLPKKGTADAVPFGVSADFWE